MNLFLREQIFVSCMILLPVFAIAVKDRKTSRSIITIISAIKIETVRIKERVTYEEKAWRKLLKKLRKDKRRNKK